MRAYNERLLIAAIRRSGALSKAEIARVTGLSSQAAMVIVDSLLDDGLLVECEKVRGHVGKPFTPIALNSSGAFSMGVKIGRRSLEAQLVDFRGDTVDSRTIRYDVPLPAQTMKLAKDTARSLVDALDSGLRDRIVGVGVAMPWMLHEWADVLELQRETIASWQEIDVAAELESATGLDVSLCNDATAACAAEMAVGDKINRRSALYIYLGSFVGGGIVINGRLYRGEQFNAGALGSMPMGGNQNDGSRAPQLIHLASAIDLERTLKAAGLEASVLTGDRNSPEIESIFSDWMHPAAEALARAVVAAVSVVDFEVVIVDGVLRPDWRSRVVSQVAQAYGKFDSTGLSPVEIESGSIGPKARVIGAAMLPLIARFSPDTELLVKTTRNSGSNS